MDASAYMTYIERLTASAESRPDVLGLVLLGSAADRSRQDEWSDHDFYWVTTDESAEGYRQHLAWLPDHEQIVLDTGIDDFPEFVINNHETHDLHLFLPKGKKYEKLTLEGSFGQRFTVMAERGDNSDRRLLALSFVAPDFMALYEDFFARASLFSQGCKFVLVTPNDFLTAERDLDRLFAGLSWVVGKIDRQVHIRTALRDQAQRILSLRQHKYERVGDPTD